MLYQLIILIIVLSLSIFIGIVAAFLQIIISKDNDSSYDKMLEEIKKEETIKDVWTYYRKNN